MWEPGIWVHTYLILWWMHALIWFNKQYPLNWHTHLPHTPYNTCKKRAWQRILCPHFRNGCYRDMIFISWESRFETFTSLPSVIQPTTLPSYRPEIKLKTTSIITLKECQYEWYEMPCEDDFVYRIEMAMGWEYVRVCKAKLLSTLLVVLVRKPYVARINDIQVRVSSFRPDFCFDKVYCTLIICIDFTILLTLHEQLLTRSFPAGGVKKSGATIGTALPSHNY